MGDYLLEIVQDVPLARFLGFWDVLGSYYISPLGQIPENPHSQRSLCLHWN